MLISERHRTIINSMTGEQRAQFGAIQARVREVAEAVRAYKSAGGDPSQHLYHYLRDHGFSNDEIWIYSPHIGGEVGADEPEWV